jgi:hypothetical protein
MRRPRLAPRGRIPASEERPVPKNAKRGDLGEVAFLHKATSLGLDVSLPYGHIHRYDFLVDNGTNIWRVQVKTGSLMVDGLYRVAVRHGTNHGLQAYTASEIDFVAAYILPEDTWYILPVREVVERKLLMFRPKGYPRRDIWAHYREAWHLLRQPDGLVFG